MNIEGKIIQRFKELEKQCNEIVINKIQGRLDIEGIVDSVSWQKWATSVMNLFQNVFGINSVQFENFKNIYEKFESSSTRRLEKGKGIFLAAKEDYEGGYIFNLNKEISGEIFADFAVLAKQALCENSKDVAAVLASAALEDTLKKYAKFNGEDLSESEMTEVVNYLKSKGLISGSQKTLLSVMPKIRNHAMHAEWSKINSEDVSSMIGFVEQFILQKFS